MKVYGEEHLYSLNAMVWVAIEHGHMGKPEEGIPLIVKALEVCSRIGLVSELEDWEKWLKRLKSLQSERENASMTVPGMLVGLQETPYPEGGEKSSRRWWKLGRKS